MTAEEKYQKRFLVFSVFFLFVSLLAILLSWRKLPPELPLFYSQPWGVEQLGSPLGLFLFPISIALFIVLIFLTKKFFSEEMLLLLMVSFTGALFSFLACFSLIKIILLVI